MQIDPNTHFDLLSENPNKVDFLFAARTPDGKWLRYANKYSLVDDFYKMSVSDTVRGMVAECKEYNRINSTNIEFEIVEVRMSHQIRGLNILETVKKVK